MSVGPDPRRDVILTGIGGQGVQLCAKILAQACVADGQHVMLSSYFGGEMRGGRTEATIVVRDAPIVDLPPIVPRLDAVVVLHSAFLDDAVPRLIDEPLVVADAWTWPETDDAAVRVPAREIAADLGAPVAAGLVLVGAFAALTGVAGAAALEAAVHHVVPPHRAAAIRSNVAALAAGADAVRGTAVEITR
jgi:2-oxoglutarate ferredoxin oxidoreductase subunit gamma